MDKKRDDDKEVTLKLPEILQIVRTHPEEFKETDLALLNDVQSAFELIHPDGSDLVPQLFFPFYDGQQNNNNLHRSTGETVYVYATDPNEPDAVPAYTINDNDDFVLYDDQLTEQEASQLDNVVVLGFNEGDEGNIPDPVDTIPSRSGNGYRLVTNLYFTGAKFTKLKESWVKGRPEVHINGAGFLLMGQHYLSHKSPIDISKFVNTESMIQMIAHGKYLRKIPRRKVLHPEFITFNTRLASHFEYSIYVNYPYFIEVNGPHYYRINMYYYYNSLPYYPWVDNKILEYAFADIVLFEYDSWPVPVKKENLYWLAPRNTPERDYIWQRDYFKYRSSDSAWAFYRVYNIPLNYYNDYSYDYYDLTHTDEDVDPPFYRDGIARGAWNFDHHTTYQITDIDN